MYNLLHGIVASARTNRYDCVSLGSLAPPPFFFYLYIYIYIYIYRIHVAYLFLALLFSALLSPKFHLFFSIRIPRTFSLSRRYFS